MDKAYLCSADFLARCKPTFNPKSFYNQYLRQEDVCTGDWSLILKGRRSFPSLHASLASSAATFVIVCLLSITFYSDLVIAIQLTEFFLSIQSYLHWSIQSRRENIFQSVAKLLFSMPPLGWAIWVCMSRIHDNRHHIQDVVAGAILGTTVSLLCFYIVIVRLSKKDGGRNNAPALEDLETGPTYIYGDPNLTTTN